VIVTENRCPKCGRARADHARACARCGLVFARWTTKLHKAIDRTLDPESEALWAVLIEHWSDDAKHDAFVKHCAEQGRLPGAGMRYREYLDTQPGDAIATKMVNRIVGMASAALLPARTAPPPQSRGRWFLWIVAFGAVGGVLAGLAFQVLSG
jgi:hypothetical protein